jgi:hypothetical protein
MTLRDIFINQQVRFSGPVAKRCAIRYHWAHLIPYPLLNLNRFFVIAPAIQSIAHRHSGQGRNPGSGMTAVRF